MSRIFNAREERYGGYLEDFEVGDFFIHWPGKTITQAEDHFFCALTLATSPLHIDANFAKSEMVTERNMVVGTFVYSLLLGMSVTDISGKAIANLGASELKHIHPFFHGDTLYGESEVLSTRISKSNSKNGILTVKTFGKNQDGIIVCEFTRAVLLPRRVRK